MSPTTANNHITTVHDASDNSTATSDAEECMQTTETSRTRLSPRPLQSELEVSTQRELATIRTHMHHARSMT